MLSETGSFSKPSTSRPTKTKPKEEAPYHKKYSYVENAAKAKTAGRRAHTIVMAAINSLHTEDELKINLKYINQGHLDDIAEERNIYEICGYPLCNKEWKDEFGKTLYIIRRNRVYDIELRRMFCSNKCFHAFEIIRSQIPTTPLYLRSMKDAEFSNLQISFPDLSTVPGQYGLLMDIGGDTSDNDTSRTAESLDHSECAPVTTESVLDDGNTYTIDSPLLDSDTEEITKKLANVYINPDDVRQDGKCHAMDHLNKPELVRQKLDDKSCLENALIVEQRIKEMMSFETLKLILGETYLRGMLEDLCKSYEEYDRQGTHLSLEAESRYAKLCRKMNQDNVEEIIENERDDMPVPSKNMPNYEQLTKDTTNCKIKVTSFFSGDKEKEDSPIEMEDDLSLPLIDSYAITAWRRKIFFDKLYKYLPHHVRKMNLNETSIAAILRPLIYSLDLSPHNIYFSPSQWGLVCLIFLKMLSIRYEVIANSFQDQGRLHMEATMALFSLDNMYLERIVPFLTDINYILAKSIPASSRDD